MHAMRRGPGPACQLIVYRHGGQGESLVPPYARGRVSPSYGGQGEILVPPYTRESVFLSRGAERTPGASLYTSCGNVFISHRVPVYACTPHGGAWPLRP